MRIDHLRVNHFEEFMGHRSEPIILSWIVTESTGKRLDVSRVEIARDFAMTNIVYDSTWTKLDPLMHRPDLELQPRTGYFWRVSGRADDGNTSFMPHAQRKRS